MHSKIEKACEKLIAEQIRLVKSQHPEASTYKEFDYNGHRYDVVSVEDKGDFWLVTAIDDTTEKWLEEQAEKNANKEIHDFYWIKSVSSGNQFELLIPVTEGLQLTIPIHNKIVNPIFTVFSPPPEVNVAAL